MVSGIDEPFTDANAALELLEDDLIPRYHRIKVLILIAAILGDWEEANQCRLDAWALYNLVRRWHPVGNDLAVDEILDEILRQLRGVDSALEEDAPEEWVLAEVQESEEIVVPNAEEDIEATREELKALNMAGDDTEATEKDLEDLNVAEDDTGNPKAELEVFKPTESAGLTLPAAAKPR